MSKSQLEVDFLHKLSERQRQVAALSSRHGKLLTHPLTRWLARDVWIGLLLLSLSLSLLLVLLLPMMWVNLVEKVLLVW